MVNAKAFLLIAFSTFLSFGCSSYSIKNADSITYSRKSIFSSGKVSFEGLRNEGGLIKANKFTGYHTNPYFTLDVSGTNVVLSEDELRNIITTK